MKGGEITNIFKNIYNSIFQNTGSNNAILCILTIIVTIIVVVYTIVILYIANNDNNTTTLTTQYTYLALIIIPIIFAFFSLFQILINDTIAFNTFLLMLIICISAFIIFIYTYLSSGYLNVVKNILYIILFFIVFVALTIYAAIFVNDVRKQNNWFGFFSNFVFYLPCLFIEFINYLMLEMKMTPQPVYVLLFGEMLLILCYFLLPYVMDKYINSNGVVILNDARKLNSSNMIINGYDLFNAIFTDEIVANQAGEQSIIKFSNSQQLLNYTISLWVFINPQNESFSKSYSKNNEISIFKYGNANDMKPMISYYNNLESNENAYRFYFSKIGGEPDYQLSLPIQKWINFTITYNNSIVDLFVNGELTRTFTFNESHPIPIYDNFIDNITIGDDNGIQGAIANIVLYKKPLSKSQIAANYNLYKQSIKI